jgi:hypothetical protein
MKIVGLILVFIVGIVFLFCYPFLRLIKFIPSTKISKLEFNETDINAKYYFLYSDTNDNKYLRQLRIDYGIDRLVEKEDNQLEKVKLVLNWAHNQWKHSGNNQPSKSNALTILKEAREGQNFRCVEYGIVTAAALQSIGIKARVLALKTRDVEQVKKSAGHVLAEAYIDDLGKWIMLDGQYNVIPMLNDIPLNAVEFQRAIIKKQQFKLVNISGDVSPKLKKSYMKFIPYYLYYFDINFDNREKFDKETREINGKRKLMLVPIGAKFPAKFQRKYPIDYCEYTNNIKDFYRKP